MAVNHERGNVNTLKICAKVFVPSRHAGVARRGGRVGGNVPTGIDSFLADALARENVSAKEIFEELGEEGVAIGGDSSLDHNIDTACLAAQGSLVVFGTDDGRVFRSLDEGARWTLMAEGLPTITAVTTYE